MDIHDIVKVFSEQFADLDRMKVTNIHSIAEVIRMPKMPSVVDIKIFRYIKLPI